jgi:hypothetical protein
LSGMPADLLVPNRNFPDGDFGTTIGEAST